MQNSARERCFAARYSLRSFCLLGSKAKTSSHFRSARLRGTDKPDSVPPSGGDSHVSGMCVATHLKRLSCFHAWSKQARPCTEVRILPLHPFVSERLFPKESFPFRSRRHCSHLSPRGGRALPATLLPDCSGLCPDFPPHEITHPDFVDDPEHISCSGQPIVSNVLSHGAAA